MQHEYHSIAYHIGERHGVGAPRIWTKVLGAVYEHYRHSDLWHRLATADPLNTKIGIPLNPVAQQAIRTYNGKTVRLENVSLGSFQPVALGINERHQQQQQHERKRVRSDQDKMTR